MEIGLQEGPLQGTSQGTSQRWQYKIWSGKLCHPTRQHHPPFRQSTRGGRCRCQGPQRVLQQPRRRSSEQEGGDTTTGVKKHPPGYKQREPSGPRQEIERRHQGPRARNFLHQEGRTSQRKENHPLHKLQEGGVTLAISMLCNAEEQGRAPPWLEKRFVTVWDGQHNK